jgi:hypothetical protein
VGRKDRKKIRCSPGQGTCSRWLPPDLTRRSERRYGRAPTTERKGAVNPPHHRRADTQTRAPRPPLPLSLSSFRLIFSFLLFLASPRLVFTSAACAPRVREEQRVELVAGALIRRRCVLFGVPVGSPARQNVSSCSASWELRSRFDFSSLYVLGDFSWPVSVCGESWCGVSGLFFARSVDHTHRFGGYRHAVLFRTDFGEPSERLLPPPPQKSSVCLLA